MLQLNWFNVCKFINKDNIGLILIAPMASADAGRERGVIH